MKLFFTLLLLVVSGTQSLYSQCWRKIASKYDYTIAIHLDGTLWNWGGNGPSQRALKTPTMLNSDTTWTEIATGEGFQAAIKADGTLWMWGDNSYGQLGNGTTTNAWALTQVGTATDWKKVSCGAWHTAALKTDGTLWVWGRNNYGQLGTGTGRTNSSTPAQLGTDVLWTDISAGRYHTLVRKSAGSLSFVGACYGTQVSQLHQVGAANEWKAMSAGATTDYAIKQTGTLWKWDQSAGSNTAPVQVGTNATWKKVDNGHESSALLIRNDGTLWAIGANTFGQLGNGTLTAATLPVQVGTATDWKDAVAGNQYSFALREDADFWAWGRNNHAQFGNGKNKNTPQPVSPANTWETVSSSTGSYNGHTLAIQDNGTLWAWGQNNDGQLGNGTTYLHSPVPVAIGTDSWSSITNGFHFSAGVKSDGTLWTWGRNARGQLALGDGVSTKTIPTKVGTDNNWLMVSAGSEFVIALKTDGTLWAWGYNSYGQLGNGNTNTQFTPVQIGTGTSWKFIATGDYHTLAIKSDSTLWSWGYNTYGQLGRAGSATVPVQVGTSKWKTVSGGGLHSLGIKADSTLWSWGRNLYAQLGDNTESNRSVPTAIGTANTWKAVAAGYEHSLAIASDSTLWAWGRNGSGQVGDSVSYLESLMKTYIPTKISYSSGWKTVDAGAVNSIAIQGNGTLFTWGDAYTTEYQTNFPQVGYVQNTPLQLSSCNYCQTAPSGFSQAICQGDSILFDGIYRSAAGSYTRTIVNAAGCDSLITMQLTVSLPGMGTDVQAACDSYQWIDGITYISSNNTATYTIPAGSANGCDSIVTLNLTINHSGTGTDVQAACVSYTWIDGNIYTASNNTATHTIPGGSANGCDSIVTLNLTISNPVTGTDVQAACVSYIWIDGNTYTASNNTATHTIPGGSVNGCDSTVTLNLTISDIQAAVSLNGITLTANVQAATYQWIDCSSNQPIPGATASTYTATANGNYAVIAGNGTCTDTSACVNVNTVGIEENEQPFTFRIYPNPGNGKFTLELSLSAEVEIQDALGRLVFAGQLHAGNESIDLSGEANGVYLVKVETEQVQSVQRLVISK